MATTVRAINEAPGLTVVKRGRGRPRKNESPAKNEEKAASVTPKTPPALLESVRESELTVASKDESSIKARVSLAGRNWKAGFLGMVLGGFVPLATYEMVHYEVTHDKLYWALIAGGLVYSALTMYRWARRAFEDWAKAIGFVVLLEGTMTFSKAPWLSLAGLSILMILNGVSAAKSLIAVTGGEQRPA